MSHRTDKQGKAALIALACACLLAGCGKATTTQVKLPPVAPLVPVTPTAGQPQPEDAAVRAVLARVQAAADRTKNYQATAFTRLRQPDGSTDTNQAKITWRRPGQMAASVLDASNNKKTGTKLLFDGNHEVKIKTYFFGFIPLKITLDVADSRLVDVYKRSLKDTSTERLLATLLHPQAQVRLIGQGVSHGEAVDLVECRSPLRWNGIDKDVFGVSQRLDLPVMRDAYDGHGKVLFHMEMRDMQTNVSVSSKDFSVD